MLFTFRVQAEKILTCDYIEMGLYITADNDQVIMKFRNDTGFNSFPIFEGVVTPRMISSIQYAAEDLKDLNSHIIVSWPKDKCKFSPDNKMLMQCQGEGKFLYPAETKLKTFFIYTYSEKLQGLESNYETIKIHWGVNSELVQHFVVFPFPKNHCE